MNNFKEKVKNLLSGKTLNNTTLSNTAQYNIQSNIQQKARLLPSLIFFRRRNKRMEQLIAGLGFPVACCLGLAYYVKYQNEQMIQDNKEDKEMWKQELQYSREVNAKLLASNEVLAKEISTKLDYLLERIDK